ncbi:Hir3 protein [Saccharomycopsis crataegensis]|uniref:Hir3 protein n=1 Tax=Saccharomycopsis crataegensis TaxID=43959 RepID=A0AAV5QN22_9ASCO|nr:Hir3 protein [Saccharomycopsis crataegensis]
MSSFNPININADSKKLDEEEDKQTRELQVEQGFKIFEEALRFQKIDKYEESEQCYKSLFKLEVLRPRKNESLSPSIKSLRYLVFKNRGLLNLSRLQGEYKSEAHSNAKNDVNSMTKGPNNNIQSHQQEETQSTITTMSEKNTEESEDEEVEEENLIEKLTLILSYLFDALDYSETADDELVNVLFGIFMFFGNFKLVRILLENQLSNSKEELDIFQTTLKAYSGAPPSLELLLRRFELILTKIRDPIVSTMTKKLSKRYQRKMHALIEKLNEKLSCFQLLKKKDGEAKIENQREIDSIIIDVTSENLSDLVDSIEKLYENSNRLVKLNYCSTDFLNSHCIHVDPLASSNFDTTDRINIKDVKIELDTSIAKEESPHVQDTPTKPVADADTADHKFDIKEEQEKEVQSPKKGPQRTSKRIRLEEHGDVSFESYKDLNADFVRFTETFESVNIRGPNFNNVVTYYVDMENGRKVDSVESKQCMWYQDMNMLLKIWDKHCSSVLLRKHEEADSKSGNHSLVSEILGSVNSIDLKEEKIKPGSEKASEIEIKILQEIIKKANSKEFDANIYQVRLHILLLILGHYEEAETSEINIIVDHEFKQGDNFILNIKKYIDYYQPIIQRKVNSMLFWKKSKSNGGAMGINEGHHEKEYSELPMKDDCLKNNNDTSKIRERSDDQQEAEFKHTIISIVSIVEIFVNEYISLDSCTQQLQKSSSRETNEKIKMKEKLENKIEKWFYFGQSLFELFPEVGKSWFRFQWALLLYKQTSSRRTPSSLMSNWPALMRTDIEVLEDMLNENSKRTTPIEMAYHNYKSFPILSEPSMKNLLSRLQAQDSFAKILSNNGNEGYEKNNGSTYSKDTISLLNMILQPEEGSASMTTDQESVTRFVQSSPFDIQLRLRDILFEYYYQGIVNTDANSVEEQESNKIEFQNTFMRTLKDIVKYLNSDTYSSFDTKQRPLALLKILKYFGVMLDRLVGILQSDNWNLRKAIPEEYVGCFIEIISILNVFYLNQVSLKLAGTPSSFSTIYPKATNELKKIIVNSYILLYTSLKPLILKDDEKGTELSDQKEKKLFELSSNIHALLGFGLMCDCSSGRFLKLLQNELLSAKWTYVDLDIFQLTKCLYNLPWAIEQYEPFEHETTSVPIERESALVLTKRFLALAFEKRDPYFNNIKSDLKAVLDSFFEVIGEPNTKYERIVRADAVMETYLDSSLNSQIFRDSFYGLLDIGISKTQLDIQKIAEQGLYYVQGVMALSLFKIRKRSMQGRSAELDFVIKMFKADLFCGTRRLESWILLGQSYSFLVEDDLIWTSDKLNSDRKNNTAISQKRAILCYLMAVSIYAQMTDEQKENSKRMIALLWTLLSKEMYSSSMQPMGKLCYQLSTTPKLLLSASGYSETHSEKPIVDTSIYRTNLLSFRMAIKLSDDDWSNYYYAANLQVKLDSKPESAIKILLRSCESAKNQHGSSSEPTIEPHYRLCSLVYKYVKGKRIDINTGLRYLKQDNDFYQYKIPEEIEDIMNNKEIAYGEQFKAFSKTCVGILRKVLSHDKKKWHHKPRYRIAKILYEDFDDIAGGIEEMLTLLTLKSTNKNLITIWKPENERPGKHFLYAYQYVNFFVMLLEKSEALSTLFMTLKKLRRSGSSMINMIGAWETACRATCRLVKTKELYVEQTFTDTIIGRLVYREFIDRSQNFLGKLKQERLKLIEPRMLLLLYEVSEMRRMNNGFASTAAIDETFAAIYLRLYEQYVEKHILKKPVSQEQSSVAAAKSGIITTIGKEVSKEGENITPGVAQVVTAAKASSSTGNSSPTTSTSKSDGPVKTKVARRDIYPRAIAILKMLADEIEQLQKIHELIFDTREKKREPEKPVVTETEKASAVPVSIINDKVLMVPDTGSVTSIAPDTASSETTDAKAKSETIKPKVNESGSKPSDQPTKEGSSMVNQPSDESQVRKPNISRRMNIIDMLDMRSSSKKTGNLQIPKIIDQDGNKNGTSVQSIVEVSSTSNVSNSEKSRKTSVKIEMEESENKKRNIKDDDDYDDDDDAILLKKPKIASINGNNTQGVSKNPIEIDD